MTGHGHASVRHPPFSIDVEVRTVNNRFLKITTKMSDLISPIEAHLEGIVREFVRRGTVSVSIRVTREDQAPATRVCQATLRSYAEAAKAAIEKSGIPCTLEIGAMLQLPGVLESAEVTDSEQLLDWAAQAIRSSLQDLNRMRSSEGNAMQKQLRDGIQHIRSLTTKIEGRAPQVLEEYRNRLESRVRSGLSDLGHSVDQVDIVREVLLYSDKCDIREELVRLSSHLNQFEQTMHSGDCQGRRLDFLIQELLRETNTIGSKANDASIAHDVVDIKTVIEQLRELVQNVE
jgi:uncharacterized protein (TIGR00255 family)